jgi:hypothetical protein
MSAVAAAFPESSNRGPYGAQSRKRCMAGTTLTPSNGALM